MAKNSGPTLVNKLWGGLRTLPQKLITNVKLRVEKTPVDPSVGLTTTGTGLAGSELEQTRTDERLLSNTFIDEALPKTVVESVLTKDGQVGTKTTTYDTASLPLTADAKLVEGEVNKQGNLNEKVEVKVASVFPETMHAKSQLTKIPERFFATEVTQESSVADSTNTTPSVGTNGLGVIEQKKQLVTANKVRTETTTAPNSTVPVLGKTLDSWGIGQTETETIVADTIPLTTGFDIEKSDIKPIGGGQAIQSVVERDAAPTKEVKKAGNLGDTPAQFRRDAVVTQTLEESATSPATSVVVIGADGTVESEVKQTRTDRWEKIDTEISGVVSEVEGSRTDSWGIAQTEKETIVTEGTVSDTGFNIESSVVEPIGDDKAIKKTVERLATPEKMKKAAGDLNVIPAKFRAGKTIDITVDQFETDPDTTATDFSSGGVHRSEVEQIRQDRFEKTDTELTYATELTGQRYDSTLGIAYAITEKIGTSGTLNAGATEVEPLSDELDFATTVDKDAFILAAKEVYLSFPSRATLNLPPILQSLSVVWDESTEEGTFATDFNGSSRGHSVSLGGSEEGECHSTAQAVPAWVVEMQEVWASNIVTDSHFFLLEYPVTTAAILAKLSDQLGDTVSAWPTFKPKSHVFTAFGQSIKVSSRVSAQAHHSETVGESVSESVTTGQGGATSVATNAVTLRLPACLHGEITVADTKEVEVTAACDVGWSGINFPSVTVNQTRTSAANGTANAALSATSPADIPREGLYLIDAKVEIFQYGMAKVYAEVLDASIFA